MRSGFAVFGHDAHFVHDESIVGKMFYQINGHGGGGWQLAWVAVDGHGDWVGGGKGVRLKVMEDL